MHKNVYEGLNAQKCIYTSALLLHYFCTTFALLLHYFCTTSARKVAEVMRKVLEVMRNIAEVMRRIAEFIFQFCI